MHWEKQKAEQPPLKTLPYAAERIWRAQQPVPSGAPGRTGSNRGAFHRAMGLARHCCCSGLRRPKLLSDG